MSPPEIEKVQNSNRITAYIGAKGIQEDGHEFPIFGHDSALKETAMTDPHPGHQLDLTPAKLKKSLDDADFDIEFEKLNKAPVENTELAAFDDWHPIPKSYKFMGAKPLKDGLHHHIYSGHYGPNKSPIFYHGISDSANPDDGTMARVQVSIDETTGEPIVTESHVHPDFKGQDLGKKAYAAALAYHGKLESDYAVSRHAYKAWDSLNKLPGVHVSLKELGNPDPNRAKAHDIKALRSSLYKSEDLAKQEVEELPPHTFTDQSAFTKKMFEYLDERSHSHRAALLNNLMGPHRDLSPDILDFMSRAHFPEVRQFVHLHPKATEEHQKVANDEDFNDWARRINAAARDNRITSYETPVHADTSLNDRQLHYLAAHGHAGAQGMSIVHPNATEKHLTSAVNNRLKAEREGNQEPNAWFWVKVAGSPLATDEQVQLAADQIKKSRDRQYDGYVKRQLISRDLHEDPTKVSVALGTNKLRALRDHIEQNAPTGKMHKKDLSSAGHDVQALGVSHLLDGSGHLHHGDVQKHIDALPRLKYGVSETEYGRHPNVMTLEEMHEAHAENFRPEDRGVHRKNFLDEDAVYKYHKKQFNHDNIRREDYDSDEAYEDDIEQARQDWNDSFDIADYEHLADNDKYVDLDSYQRELESAKHLHDQDFDSEMYGVTHEDALEHAAEKQQHTYEPSEVFQLNYTKDHAEKMKQAGVYGTFKNMLEASKNSNHPIQDNTVGWVRYTKGDDGGIHIDEIQSDFGQSFVKQASNQIKQALQNGQITQEQAQAAQANAHQKWPEEHFTHIKSILFGDRHPNEILHEAFLQHMRNQGHTGSKIHMWQAKPKANLSGMSEQKQLPGHMQFTYDQHPKKMGYKPAQYGELDTQFNENLHGQPTWSDTLKKRERLHPDQIKQLADLLEDIETVDVDMPWHDIIKSSTHRWE
jgi:hypothetical protein